MVDRLLGKKVIGIKQSTKAMNNGEGIKLYIANDADNYLINSLVELAKQKDIEVYSIDTMRILGKMCGIEVKAAAALILEE